MKLDGDSRAEPRKDESSSIRLSGLKRLDPSKRRPLTPIMDIRPGDFGDQHRNARVRKPQGTRVHCVESLGWAGGEFGVDQALDGLRVLYSLESDGDIALLSDVQGADWDPARADAGRYSVREAPGAEYGCRTSSTLPNRPSGVGAGVALKSFVTMSVSMSAGETVLAVIPPLYEKIDS